MHDTSGSSHSRVVFDAGNLAVADEVFQSVGFIDQVTCKCSVNDVDFASELIIGLHFVSWELKRF